MTDELKKSFFFFKGRKKDFWEGYGGVFLRMIGPLAEAI
jgi:hypothetical protein